MTKKALTYSQAGVDISAGNEFVRKIAPLAKATQSKDVLGGLGGFSAMAKIPSRFRSPRLVLATDGVGTKILIAKEMGKWDTVGEDLVAMSVNDLICIGAEPFLFLDYYATGKLDVKQGVDVVRGIANGCKKAECSLVGGETAEMPGLYAPGDIDLAGFCVGLLEAGKELGPKGMRAGDVLIGLPSTGIHSNGFSLVRKIVETNSLSLKRTYPEAGKGTLGELLLKPTKIYVDGLKSYIRTGRVKGLAHITGGGLIENLPRVLPKNLMAVVNQKAWRIPKLFTALQKWGNVPEEDMYRTFNMGIGLVIVADPKKAPTLLKNLKGAKEIGQVEKRTKSQTPFEFSA